MTDTNLQGQLLDSRYQLGELLGQGAFGSVYRAEQLVVDRSVAIKVMHPESVALDEVRQRFEQEAKALGRLDHPNCVRVYDFGWHPELGSPYLVSEFVDGEMLFEAYDGASTVEFLSWARSIASAMAHAHEHGIMHRDLKPENVLISKAGDIKVVDFGLAFVPREDEIRLSMAGQAHGTPAYMSPEMCQAQRDLSPKIDVYSLGCMVFEMFEGDLPYWASSANAVLIKHVTDPIPPMQHAPPRVQELITRLMAKDPDDRPTMLELVEELDQLIESISVDDVPPVTHNHVATRSSAPVTHLSKPAEQQATLGASAVELSKMGLQRSNRWVFVLAGLTLVGLVGLALATITPSDAPPLADKPPLQPTKVSTLDPEPLPVADRVADAPAADAGGLHDVASPTTETVPEQPTKTAAPPVVPTAKRPKPKPMPDRQPKTAEPAPEQAEPSESTPTVEETDEKTAEPKPDETKPREAIKLDY